MFASPRGPGAAFLFVRIECVSVFMFCRPKVYIEQKALDTIAHLCDGDARAGLNGLQLAVQARVGAARPGQSGSGSTPQDIVVQEEHVKEGLQRSHILYVYAKQVSPMVQ